MPLSLRIAIAIAVLSATACDGRDEFFRQSAEEQIAAARGMSTPEVYDLYKKSFEQPFPPLPDLAVVLGERGSSVLDLWISELGTESGLTANYEYAPLLVALKEQRGVTLCSERRRLEKAVHALAEAVGAEVAAARRELLKYC